MIDTKERKIVPVSSNSMMPLRRQISLASNISSKTATVREKVQVMQMINDRVANGKLMDEIKEKDLKKINEIIPTLPLIPKMTYLQLMTALLNRGIEGTKED